MKKVIASILTATFLLTIIGIKPPKIFAEDNFEITAKVAEDTFKEETQKQLNKILKKLNEQDQLNKLKEKLKELEEKLGNNNFEYEKKEDNYFSKNGIKNILNHFSKVFSAGVYTLLSECLLLSIPLVKIYAASLLSIYHIGVLLPFIAMIKIAIRLYEDGCAQDKLK